MRRLIATGPGVLAALGLLSCLPACHHRQPPPPPPVIEAPPQVLAPWSWHKLGGLLVVEGEVDAPVDLVLRGHYLNERMHAEFGPVRWEMYAPPVTEIAELRTSEGKVLAQWNFAGEASPEPESPKTVPPAAPKVAEPPVPLPQPSAPAPPPPAPTPPAPRPVEPPKAAPPLPPPSPAAPPKPAPQATPAIPPPAPPAPKPVAQREPDQESWPETHLPRFDGSMVKARPVPPPPPAAPPKSASQAAPAIPPPAPPAPGPVAQRNPDEKSWLETHLPRFDGSMVKARPLPPPPSAAPPKSASQAAPAIPAPAPPAPKPVAQRNPDEKSWLETHLPRFDGSMVKTRPVPPPPPAAPPKSTSQAAPVIPPPAPPPPKAVAQRKPDQKSWPETHLPRFDGSMVKARPVSPTPALPPASVPPPAPLPPVPQVAKAVPIAPLPVEPKPTPKPLAKPAAPAKPLAQPKSAPSPEPRPPVKPAAPMAPPVPAKPVPQTKPEPKPVPNPEPRPTLPPVTPSPQEWPGAGEALNLIRGPRGSHWVCMTFDGGSTAEVATEVLDALKERNIHTTFFLTGAFIQKYPDIVRRMDREGHEIGNHTMDHPHFAPRMVRDPRWTKERFQQQLLMADALLLKLLGHPMDPYWRAPYGEQTTELRRWAEELGYRHVGWSEGADTLDWATVKERKLYRTGNAILDRLHDRMEKQDGDGLIVLMHLGSERPESDRPARVLGPFLDKALEEGWNFVNISAYLKESGKPRWNSSNRLAMLGRATPRQ